MNDNEKEIQNWMRAIAPNVTYNIDDELINVYGDIDLRRKNLTNLPFAFGVIQGSFCCNDNELKSFHNFPREITGYFECCHTLIKSLKDCPQKVGKRFVITGNLIEVINASELPQSIGLDFMINHKNNKKVKYLEEFYEVYAMSSNPILIQKLDFLKKYLLMKELEGKLATGTVKTRSKI